MPIRWADAGAGKRKDVMMVSADDNKGDDAGLTGLSRFLSLVLRHQPQLIGIDLDANGWVPTADLIEKATRYGVPLDEALLDTVVKTSAKQRFSFNGTRDKIRANQGHSVTVALEYAEKEPPEILYHGSALKSAASIMAFGLERRNRHHVHLSTDIQTAINVGKRHGKPVVFIVFAGRMHADGHSFYLSDNGVWLTDHVPARYLQQGE